MATRGSSLWRETEWGPHCVASEIVGIAIYAGGPRFQCNKLARDSFTLLGAKFLKHRYVINSAGGYNCRAITGGRSYSSHAWGISVDVNEGRNPYRRDRPVTDMPQAMIGDIYTIRTAFGVQVFRWGGDWDGRPEVPNSNYDAMHFEIIATPEELAAGFDVDVPEAGRLAPITHFPVIRRGARGPIVVELQDLLHLERTTGNGIFGPRTDAAVRLYQKRHGLEVDGIVGHGTWTALLTNQPPLSLSGISPQKVAA
jgi:hypothetical protein